MTLIRAKHSSDRSRINIGSCLEIEFRGRGRGFRLSELSGRTVVWHREAYTLDILLDIAWQDYGASYYDWIGVNEDDSEVWISIPELRREYGLLVLIYDNPNTREKIKRLTLKEFPTEPGIGMDIDYHDGSRFDNWYEDLEHALFSAVLQYNVRQDAWIRRFPDGRSEPSTFYYDFDISENEEC